MATTDFEVKFWLDEDGKHIVFQHHCPIRETWKPVTDPDGGEPYSWNPVKAMLPIGAEDWQVMSKEPITVKPSIQCMSCGCHGFITNGVWAPC